VGEKDNLLHLGGDGRRLKLPFLSLKVRAETFYFREKGEKSFRKERKSLIAIGGKIRGGETLP